MEKRGSAKRDLYRPKCFIVANHVQIVSRSDYVLKMHKINQSQSFRFKRQ